jgi:hypothetical protein
LVSLGAEGSASSVTKKNEDHERELPDVPKGKPGNS